MRPWAVLLFIIVSGYIVCVHTTPPIGIIGGGIGGAATSYYLNKFGGISGLDVYESRSYIGGRINEIQFGGQIVEVGADAWSSANYYLQELYQDLGLALGNYSSVGNGEVGIWGDSFLHWKKLILNYPLVDACVAVQIEKFLSQLTENYLEREKSGPFTSINQFLQAGKMTFYLETNMTSYLSYCNATQDYQDTLVAPIVRAIYGQSLSLQSFAGEVSLVSISTPAHWVANGNSQLPKGMFSSSKANVRLNTQVTQVEWNGKQFAVSVQSSNEVQLYDVLVLAAPFEKTGISYKNITFFSEIVPRDFVKCFVTHVQADRVNPLFFGMASSEIVPDSILTTPESDLPFTILSIVDESLEIPGKKIYKLFSKTNIEHELSSIFLGLSDFHVEDWDYTFPELITTTSFQPVQLAQNLYYLNTMESVASAMEGSVIIGRNVAQLIIQQN